MTKAPGPWPTWSRNAGVPWRRGKIAHFSMPQPWDRQESRLHAGQAPRKGLRAKDLCHRSFRKGTPSSRSPASKSNRPCHEPHTKDWTWLPGRSYDKRQALKPSKLFLSKQATKPLNLQMILQASPFLQANNTLRRFARRLSAARWCERSGAPAPASQGYKARVGRKLPRESLATHMGKPFTLLLHGALRNLQDLNGREEEENLLKKLSLAITSFHVARF